jgi:hypothetical protein
VNSNLYGKTIELPKEIVEYLGTCFDYVPNSDPSIEGHKRNIELRDTGYVTYQQLGRIKNWFDNYSGDGKDAPFILNGAEYMKNWVDNTLRGLRTVDAQSNEIQKNYMPDQTFDDPELDLGPIGDMLRPSKQHSTFVQDVKITEDVKRINQLMKKII